MIVSRSVYRILLCLPLAAAQLRNFYIDCSETSPGNGTLERPWNALAYANSFTFLPGDILSLKSNVTCSGTLSPLGSGNATHPIRLTSYPTDSIDGPPVINGNGGNSSLYLLNQDYWRVSRLGFTNPGEGLGRRQGVLIQADDGKPHFNITLDRNTIYDVAGQTDKGNFSSDFANSAGISLAALEGSIYSGVSIRDNVVKDCGGGAIKVRPGQVDNLGDNIRVYYNTIESCGGDGIVVSYADSPLIDHNIAANLGKGKYPWSGGNFAGIWVMAAHNPVMRQNVVYGSIMSVHDSTAFDCDWGVSGTCIVEYNYSHDNAGGAFLDCDGCGESKSTHQIVRYNIFENDCRMISVGETATLDFYNNVMYCSEKDFELQVPQVTRFTNNIFVGRRNATLPLHSGITWKNNMFHKVTPPTENGLLGDPMFVDPVQKGNTLGAGFGYKLRETSLALDSGMIVKDAGKRDYFGNDVAENEIGNIGPYNGPALK